MLSYLLKILFFFLFSFFVILNFYSFWHSESFTWYALYISIIFVIYAVYKWIQTYSWEKIAKFSLLKLIWFFLLNLFILCIFYFNLQNINWWNWIILFFKILFFSLVPISIFYISTAFWRKLISYLPKKELLDSKLTFLLSLWIWFSSFLTLLTIFWIFSLYNIYVVLLILIWFWAFAWKEIISLFRNFLDYKIEYKIEEGSYLRLLSAEFFFLIASIVLWVGLIMVFRPFPIGWDDLWVYMNYPHLMSENGSILSLWGMYSWQIFTWIWYMFGSPTFAFYLNISWVFLSFITLLIIFSDLLNFKTKNEKSELFMELPIILATIFISLPMVVFQSMKDMKVDEWLFFITIIILYSLYKYFIINKEKTEEKDKFPIIYIFIIWILTWFAFSIKFTALLLIVSVLAVISYSRLKILWFLWYLFLFLGIFTFGNLWKMMNVIVNPNNIENFNTNTWWILIIIWVFLLAFASVSNKEKLTKFFKEVLLFLAWIIVILLPWFWKNINESYPNLSVSTLLSWKSVSYKMDLEKIYSKSEIENIKEKYTKERKKENLVTTNEDMLRYFWYEKGILNYLNMPWNLTMQLNQGWEFTNISFLFFALLPLIFIFLVYKNRFFPIFFVFLALFQFFYYYNNSYEKVDKQSVTSIQLAENQDKIFAKNINIFNESFFGDDIYDIKFLDYLDKNLLNTILKQNNLENNSKSLSLISKTFYNDLKTKIANNDESADVSFWQKLTEKDLKLLKKLEKNYNENYLFISKEKASLKELMTKLNIPLEKQEKLLNLWDSSRSFKWKFTDLFSELNIPFWYIFIFLGFFLPFLFLIFSLKKSKENYLFKLNLVFTTLYTFLWMISSFWIVWYGITMYFWFLLMIWFWAYNITYYSEKEEIKNYYYKILGTIIFLIIVLIYFFQSVFPHTFTNLKNSSYISYKMGKITSAASVFERGSDDYLDIISTLNIDENKKTDFLKANINEEIFSKIKNPESMTISEILDILKKIKTWKLKIENNNSRKNITYQNDAEKAIENIYKNIINPKEEFKNKNIIYRVWTFFKYYISENNKRLLEDSLLFKFNDYIYSENEKETISNMKKLWLKYILLDLNAATIDKSETHDLTKRYEKMLKTILISDDLELISTDNICLRIWKEYYKNMKNLEEAMYVAWVNYESYDKNNKQISRSTKQKSCAKFIKDLVDSNAISEKNYPFLAWYENYIKTNNLDLDWIKNLLKNSKQALFEIK